MSEGVVQFSDFQVHPLSELPARLILRESPEEHRGWHQIDGYGWQESPAHAAAGFLLHDGPFRNDGHGTDDDGKKQPHL